MGKAQQKKPRLHCKQTAKNDEKIKEKINCPLLDWPIQLGVFNFVVKLNGLS